VNHLEGLIAEYYDWKGYLVKRNVKVGKRDAGGWEMELDIVAFDPHSGHLLHVEASLDAHAWVKREARYAKKFSLGEKYILNEVFTWLPSDTVVDRIAIFPSCPKDRTHIAGGRLMSIDRFMRLVRDEIEKGYPIAKDAIPEQYPLLRTLQLALKGYYRVVAEAPTPPITPAQPDRGLVSSTIK
jgi:hypothetical protein